MDDIITVRTGGPVPIPEGYRLVLAKLYGALMALGFLDGKFELVSWFDPDWPRYPWLQFRPMDGEQTVLAQWPIDVVDAIKGGGSVGRWALTRAAHKIKDDYERAK